MRGSRGRENSVSVRFFTRRNAPAPFLTMKGGAGMRSGLKWLTVVAFVALAAGLAPAVRRALRARRRAAF